MRTISEKTIITALVNFKCAGKFGKCFHSLSQKERGFAIDEMINRGWLTERMELTLDAQPVILENLHLCQY